MIGLESSSALSNFPAFILSAAKSPLVYVSIAIQGFGYVLWMMLIARMKLGVASASVGAGFYVCMALAAWGIYGESLSRVQWLATRPHNPWPQLSRSRIGLVKIASVRLPVHHSTTPGAAPHLTALGQLRADELLIRLGALGREIEILGAQQRVRLDHVQMMPHRASR